MPFTLCSLEAEGVAEMVQGSVDLAERRFDVTDAAGGAAWGGVDGEGGERAEQARAQLDQQHPELEPACDKPVAPSRANPFDEPMGPQLAQVVAELAQPVVVRGQLVTGQEAGVHLPGGPIGDEGTGV